jgi:hypothetical protein
MMMFCGASAGGQERHTEFDAFCDDDRIKLIFDALSRAGRRQQIIALT